jgi:hypothetical protein
MSGDFECGTHLVSNRWGYAHHGLYVNEGKVIHYSGYAAFGVVGKVEVVPLEAFAAGNPVYVVEHAYEKFSRDACVRRAYTRLGEDCYDLFGNNCEHFVLWCVEDWHGCPQVDRAAAAAVGVGAAMGAGAGVGVVAATGAVYGLSASGIMSGLATVGGVIGGGAAFGIGLIGAAPAMASACLLSQTLYKVNDAQPPSEQAGRKAGVYVTAVAGAAGSAGTIGVVGALGATGTLSGAGIASGLAALGGSMVGGVAVATAAPAVAAAVAGYCVYLGVTRWRRSYDPPPTPKLQQPADARFPQGEEDAFVMPALLKAPSPDRRSS